jgi:hypothetical protein
MVVGRVIELTLGIPDNDVLQSRVL